MGTYIIASPERLGMLVALFGWQELPSCNVLLALIVACRNLDFRGGVAIPYQQHDLNTHAMDHLLSVGL